MQVARLEERLDGWGKHLERRISDVAASLSADVATRHHDNGVRHQEVLGRLDSIDGKVGDAHRQIGVLEGVTGSLRSEYERLRQRVHEIGNRAQEAASTASLALQRFGERRVTEIERIPLTLKHIWWIVGILVAVIVATFSLMVGPLGYHKP